MSLAATIERFPRLRQSRLSTFDSCALQAHFEEEYRRDWTGHAQARGQIFHRVAARALKHMHKQDEQQIPTDAILEILFDVLRQADIDLECPSCGKEIVQRSDGWCVCAAGHRTHSDFVNIPFREIKDLRWEVVKFAHDNVFDIANLVDVEHRLVASLTYGEGDDRIERVLTGRLDAMFVTGEDDEEAVVLDYKSTWDMPAPSEVGFAGFFQQRFYAWLVMRNYPAIQRVTLREHYTRYSEFREATVERYELEYVEAELSALAERFDRAFADSNFPPSPGRQCQVCPRPAACPIFPGVRQVGAITDDETARRFAGNATVARRALKMYEDALKAWSSVRGDVPINSTPGRERVLGFVERERTSRPKREDLERALYLHGSRIKIDELYPTKKITRFEPHYPQPVEDEPVDALLMNALEQSVAEQQSD